jgi:ribonucleoside-diphosphate reductase alpha chain
LFISLLLLSLDANLEWTIRPLIARGGRAGRPTHGQCTHRRAAHGQRSGYEQMTTPPVPLDLAAVPDQQLVTHARAAWDRALTLGEAHGYRNAQATVVAPTGTIGLVMDCDTTGIEPDFALVKFKKLAGGGYFKIINRAVPEALRVLGYGESDIAEIIAYAVGSAFSTFSIASGVKPLALSVV